MRKSSQYSLRVILHFTNRRPKTTIVDMAKSDHTALKATGPRLLSAFVFEGKLPIANSTDIFQEKKVLTKSCSLNMNCILEFDQIIGLTMAEGTWERRNGMKTAP